MAVFTKKSKSTQAKQPRKRLPTLKRPRTPSQRLEHERLVSLINSMGDGVIAVNSKLKVVVYNGAALNILDSNTSMRDKPLAGLITLLDKTHNKVDLADIIKNTHFATSSRDYSIKYSDGTTAALYLSIAPVHRGYGKRVSNGYVLVLRDITREKSLEDERNEFISVVSHELRTPIAIAEGNISNALFVAEKDGKDNGNQMVATALQAAHDQVLFLADMINDLATLSRAERGTLTLEVERIIINDLLKELNASYAPQAEAKGLKFTVQSHGTLHALSSSKLYTREVLQNFITNALKYTESGHVTLSAQNIKSGIRFTVQDTGIGISKSDQEKVFDKFFRSEDFKTRQNTGTGLGLYVTMKLSKLLQANISLQSSVGNGSTFTIDIPNIT